MAEQAAADVVVGVHIRPIKSCHEATVDGALPEALPVGPTGFEINNVRDRDFVIVDEADWTPVTQRGWGDPDVSRAVKHPEDRRLATVRVDLRSDHLLVDTPSIGHMEIGADPIDGPSRSVRIFGKELPAIDQGDDPAAYFSRIVGRAVRLVRADRNHPRLVREQYRRPDASNMVAGADGYPFLLVSQASLNASHQLNGFAPGTVPLNRFRGNIEISGDRLGPYDEDYIRKLQIGTMAAYIVKACARCPIPNVDQETGIFNASTGLKVLRGRKGVIEPGDSQLFFGQNVLHIWQPDQVIAIGDPVKVLERADTRNLQLTNPDFLATIEP